MKTITISNPNSAIKLSAEQFKALGIDTQVDEIRLKTEHRGPWQIMAKCSGLCISSKFGKFSRVLETKIFGQRTLSRVRQGGYELNGHVSVEGRSYPAFTSSQLFETEEGHFIDIGVIFACMNREEETV